MQGTYDAAAKGTLQSEFDTSVDDDVIKIILEKGTLQTSEVSRLDNKTNALLLLKTLIPFLSSHTDARTTRFQERLQRRHGCPLEKEAQVQIAVNRHLTETFGFSVSSMKYPGRELWDKRLLLFGVGYAA